MIQKAMSRHQVPGTYRLLKMLGEADGRAKGQAPGDPWQLLAAIVIGLAGSSRRRAA
jgi:DNA polymerase III delta subunit